MSPFEIISILLTLAAVFAYINHRWLQQPASVALMAMALAVSLLLLLLERLGWVQLRDDTSALLERIDFDQTFLHGLLGALLFASALQIRLADLREEKLAISALALVATLLSTGLVAGLTFALVRWAGLPLDFG
ncbi:MAG TPA: cation:proton antiporter, partial [Polyangiaceae bacterium]